MSIELGERIRIRREQLDMTQDDLAFECGFKSRSSVNKIEKGVQSLPLEKVVIFAKALKTTPDYIMGWIDDPDHTPTKDEKIAEFEEMFYMLTPDQQKVVSSVISAIVSRHESSDH